MGTFNYHAKNADGEYADGTIEAINQEEALDKLEKQQLCVVSIKSVETDIGKSREIKDKVADNSLQQTGISKCPYCSEQIQADAKKCRHCGEWLDEASRTAKNVASPVDANTIARGMVQKEGMDALSKIGGVVILFISCFIGVWLNSFWVGVVTFFLLFIPFSIWCYK